MRAITQDRYGPPDVLSLEEVPIPEPASGQVRVRVRAASLNMYDWHMITGTPLLVRITAGFTRPKHLIPGADMAGVVEAVGEGVTRLAVGDEVAGSIGHGAFAEKACVNESRLAHKPPEIGFEQAAALPMAGVTALQALRDVGGVQPGQRVLVNGASGGVGTYAVQLARALGAGQITAVCSTTKIDQARALGADDVVDYTETDFTATARDHHLVIDNAGNRGWSDLRRVLAPEGSVVATTGPKHRVLGPLRPFVWRKLRASLSSQQMAWVQAVERREDVAFLIELVRDGAVTPVIEETYPLEKLPEALRYLGEGHARGKLVILP